MLVRSSQSISDVYSQGKNCVSVTHKLTVRLEIQPHCSQQGVSKSQFEKVWSTRKGCPCQHLEASVLEFCKCRWVISIHSFSPLLRWYHFLGPFPKIPPLGYRKYHMAPALCGGVSSLRQTQRSTRVQNIRWSFLPSLKPVPLFAPLSGVCSRQFLCLILLFNGGENTTGLQGYSED